MLKSLSITCLQALRCDKKHPMVAGLQKAAHMLVDCCQMSSDVSSDPSTPSSRCADMPILCNLARMSAHLFLDRRRFNTKTSFHGSLMLLLMKSENYSTSAI